MGIIAEGATQSSHTQQRPQGMGDTSPEFVTQNAGEAMTGQHRNYNQRFRAYLTRNLHYVFQLVKAEAGTLSEELRVQALHSLSYALSVTDEWIVARDLLFMLAPNMELEGYREDWLPYLQKGLTQSIALSDDRATAECHFQIGLIQRMLSEFDLAETHLLQSVACYEQLQAKRDQARALNELAWLAQLQHHFDEAEARVAEAIALVDENDPERAVSFRVQGVIASGHQDWARAEALHREALRRFESHGDERRAAWSIHNIGYALHGQKRYTEAIVLYQQAMVIMERIGDEYHLAIAQTNLGIVYYNTKQLDNSLHYYEVAAEFAKKLRNQLQLARIQTNFGLTHLALGNNKQAQSCFVYSSDLCGQLGNIDLYLNAQDGLAMALLAQGEHEQAFVVIHDALSYLPQIEESPHFSYLNESLHERLRQAEERQDFSDGFYLF